MLANRPHLPAAVTYSRVGDEPSTSRGGGPHGSVMAMITDAGGRLAFANRDLLAFGGWRWQDLAGRLWHEALISHGPRERVAREFDEALASVDGPAYVEAPIRARDGSVHTIAWSPTTTHDERGNTQTITSIGIDVSWWAEERDRLVAEREFESSHDGLTGLANATSFRSQLGIELSAGRDAGDTLGVLLVGIDRFRAVIETLGHEAGDRLIREVAERIRAAAKGWVVARWSGDEFAVLLPRLRDQEQAIAVARAIVDAMSLPCISCSTEFHLGASVGIVVAPHDGENATTLMRHAAMATRQAKAGGGLRHALFQASLSRDAKERILLEQQLHGALGRLEISIVYQPQVDAGSHRIVGLEALARWHHPVLGDVSPARFIPLAEEIGVIAPLGRFVLESALRHAQQWRQEGLGEVTVAVNISAHQLGDRGLVDDVLRFLEETETPPRLLELEITESAAMVDSDSAAEILSELAAIGITISLDDFGTGYSNLGKLHELAISTIKIDRSFLLEPSPEAAEPGALLRALVTLGRNLDLRVIAEGVETEEQLCRLQAQGLDAYQGYLFSRPIVPAEVRRLLQKGTPLRGLTGRVAG
jgi:diguanylate cyclase (GGDEF)-like protein/PAS domain S-box-containing protein